jgi:hypothetical protein
MIIKFGLYITLFIVILIILYTINLLFIQNKYNNENFDSKLEQNYEDSSFSTNKYKYTMLNNNKEKLYKISLDKNIEILRDECYEKCDRKQCLILDDRTKWFEKCTKCNLQDKKCFNKSIIGGNCDDCDIDDIKDKINCSSIDNYGCANPNNLNNLSINNGVLPYYIDIPDNNVNSPFNKKCVFCWNLMDNI